MGIPTQRKSILCYAREKATHDIVHLEALPARQFHLLRLDRVRWAASDLTMKGHTWEGDVGGGSPRNLLLATPLDSNMTSTEHTADVDSESPHTHTRTHFYTPGTAGTGSALWCFL